MRVEVGDGGSGERAKDGRAGAQGGGAHGAWRRPRHGGFNPGGARGKQVPQTDRHLTRRKRVAIRETRPKKDRGYSDIRPKVGRVGPILPKIGTVSPSRKEILHVLFSMLRSENFKFKVLEKDVGANSERYTDEIQISMH